ncbi:DUF4252 domain-containing protein [Aureisphaera galaxeae]|uniref:DUF4252 domain-containing protein n=1 Tax=Aureisphaera galaxeae TaxID=1538023 RepID=UPI00234FF3F2|nr:DUF4252 domain-containing protein [Aureisphaera galaxeae]MDC8003696.1 DUF4252 domain-containing protein [Aureisphaera galaxeae]
MKKIAILMALLITPMLVTAQSVFDSYEEESEVTSVVVTKNMFKLLSKIEVDSNDPEVQEYMEMVNSLNNIKVFITEDDGIGSRMKADVQKYVSASKGLEELMRVRDDGKNVKFYSKQGKDENHVSELLMFLEGEMDGKEGTVIMSITGDIDLKQISKLTKDLNVPGSDELENVKNKG